MYGLTFWILATCLYFIFNLTGFELAPIAKDGPNSLISVYIPVLVLTVFLLLYLTRNRKSVEWEKLYAVNKSSAKREAWIASLYLLTSQIILGYVFNMGLHFPGTDVYTTRSHTQVDVWIWALTYTLVYTVLPLIWLKKRGFSLKKLFSSFRWIRDLWIIIAYWALDFFGPILSGSTNFLGGMNANQYAQGISLGILVNTLGAGLPVVVMMHMIFIPRIAVLFKSKFTVILLGGLFYSIFSLFDPGVDYGSMETTLTSITYIIMTQTLVGMGKSSFTVVTGNPFVHFITLHVISARVPFDTRMYIEIFKIK